MNTWLTFTLVLSGGLGLTLMSSLPYLEKKATQERGLWTMTAITSKMDSKRINFSNGDFSYSILWLVYE